jgi:hypothetical protein
MVIKYLRVVLKIVGLAARMGKIKNLYNIFVGKPKRK